ncbi:MAG: hypothetical protein ETSY1_46140 (plasmid) [Candidatus Entotheonella factor]|uniref:Methyltransferase type 11 domain-containing protein n=2 Tax=Bacteria TaxID=2 RepID=W4M2D5_ENTF1|nr:OnnD [symbiont bacterium of Theonella swinhoei]ETX03782.1 MAG: hypothetical protein ETSY1_46140 [Candidatus Entotheonella factor]
MTVTQYEFKNLVKERLFNCIARQIDMIGHVPGDLSRMVGSSLDAADDHSEGHWERPTELTELINAHYDRFFYEQHGVERLIREETDFKNLGYWDDTTLDLNAAAERLFKTLMAMIPKKSGRILDAGCGTGGATRRLLESYPPENVWAINISAKQIETTKQNVKGCHAIVMNAVDMTFEDNFFDTVLSIEAAMHFETRRKFLEESFRVLKQDGCLVLSDILFTSQERLEQNDYFGGVSNHIETIEDYQQLMEEIGFRNVVVKDVSKAVWGSNFLYNINKLHKEFYHGRLDLIQLTETLWSMYYVNSIFSVCLFTFGQK